MRETEVKVINSLGLHARAAAQLVRMSAQYSSKITLHRSENGGTANAKSILSLLALAASKGSLIQVIVEGDDEEAALAAVEGLFANGFGEL